MSHRNSPFSVGAFFVLRIPMARSGKLPIREQDLEPEWNDSRNRNGDPKLQRNPRRVAMSVQHRQTGFHPTEEDGSTEEHRN